MDEITALKRERGQIIMTVNEDEVIRIPMAVYREQPLQVGETFDLAAYDEWLLLHQYRYALDRAVGYLAARPCSRREIEQKLRRVGYRPNTIEMVLYKLEKEKLLNDEEFADTWVQQRSQRQLGRRRIEMELRQKGVDRETIDQALAAVDEDTEVEQATLLVQKKLRSILAKDEPVYKQVQRLAAMLARRGYSWDVAKQAIDRAMRTAEDEDD